MVSTWKKVSIFISSTFRDMQAERDYLVRFVFPRIRKKLHEKKIHLVDVDLRWGLRFHEDITKACINLIDECRPRFICILGGRYGTVLDGQSRSVTHDEIHHAVFHDENQCRFSFFYFRENKSTDEMDEGDESGIYREIPGSETEKLLLELKKEISDRFKPYFYSARWSSELKRLVDLTEFGNRVEKDILQSIRDDEELSDRVENGSDSVEKDESSTVDFSFFMNECLQGFCATARRTVIEKCIEFIEKPTEQNVLHLYGKSGSGKTALLAYLCNAINERLGSGSVIIPFFVGATKQAATCQTLLKYLCQNLGAYTKNKSFHLPMEHEELDNSFADLCRKEYNVNRVILIIDGLNQMDASDHSQVLAWLPFHLPEVFRVIVSTTTADSDWKKEVQNNIAFAALQIRKNQVQELPLYEFDRETGEGTEERKSVISENTKLYYKNFEQDQIQLILGKKESGNPLYLRMVLEELRTVGSHNLLSIIRDFPGTTEELFLWILNNRLSQDPGFMDDAGRTIGSALVRTFISCLAVSRDGLTLQELISIIDPGDPRGNVAALERFLRPYLMYRGETLTFLHHQVRTIVLQSFSLEEELIKTAHEKLVVMFWKGVYDNRKNLLREPNAHAISELAYHLLQVNHWDALDDLFHNVDFLICKLQFGFGHDLLNDLRRIESKAKRTLELGERYQYYQNLAILLIYSFEEINHHPVSFLSQLRLNDQVYFNNKFSTLFPTLRGEQSMHYLERVKSESVYEIDSVIARAGFLGFMIHFIEFSKDGEKIIYIDRQGKITRFDWRSFEIVSINAPSAHCYHFAAILSANVLFLVDYHSNVLFETDDLWEGNWERSRFREVYRIQPPMVLGRLAYDPHNKTIIQTYLNDYDIAFLVFDTETWECTQTWRAPNPTSDPHYYTTANYISYSPDYSLRAACFSDGYVAVNNGWYGKVFDAGAFCSVFITEEYLAVIGNHPFCFIIDVKYGIVDMIPLCDFTASDYLAYDPHTHTLLIGHRTGGITKLIWNRGIKEMSILPSGVSGRINALQFSPCGNYFAVCGNLSRVCIHEIKKSKEIMTIRNIPRPFSQIQIYEDMEFLTFFDLNNYLHSTCSQRNTSCFPFPCMAYTYDRKNRNILAYSFNVVLVLDRLSGEPLYSIAMKNRKLRSMLLNHSSDRFACADGDKIVLFDYSKKNTLEELWSANTTELIKNSEEMNSLCLSQGIPMVFAKSRNLLIAALQKPILVGNATQTGSEPPRMDLIKQNRAFAFFPTKRESQHNDLNCDVQMIPYDGCCTCLLLVESRNLLIAGFGREFAYQQTANGNYTQTENTIRLAAPMVIVYNIDSRTEMFRFVAPESDDGVTDLAYDEEQNLLFVSMRNGRLRIASIHENAWKSSLTFPDRLFSVAIDEKNKNVFVADSGESTGYYPVLHKLSYRYLIAQHSFVS